CSYRWPAHSVCERQSSVGWMHSTVVQGPDDTSSWDDSAIYHGCIDDLSLDRVV
ncbi:hypothetical protein KI387_000979, partial [Taxus chinensis]